LRFLVSCLRLKTSNLERQTSNYLINPAALLANIFTAIASKITPKNFLTANKPALPKAFSIRFNERKTI